uniref:Uncharacterized protein n=1 Tax=Oryza rufipogon TaxID=4529 RepID=A0A0E0P5S2_ORYRU
MNEFCSCMEDCVGFCWRICNLGVKPRARPRAGLGGGGEGLAPDPIFAGGLLYHMGRLMIFVGV